MSITLFIILAIILDLVIRYLEFNKNEIENTIDVYIYEIIVICILIFYYLRNYDLTNNMYIVFIILVFILLYDYLLNLFATIYLYFTNTYNYGDIIQIKYDNKSFEETKKDTTLLFKNLGFIKTQLYDIDGDGINVPNKVLLQNTILKS